MKRLITMLLVSVLCLTSGISQTTIVLEDFESLTDTAAPAGWLKITQATDGGWLAGTNTALQSQYWPIPAHTKMMATNDDKCNCNKMSDILITPSYNLSAYTSVFLSVDVFYNEGSYNSIYETATIMASVDNGSTWATIKTLDGSMVWETVILNSTEYGGDTNVRFAFKYSDGGDWLYGFAIDNFKLYVPLERDVALLSTPLPEITVINVPLNFNSKIKNLGSDTITSLDLVWSVNGGNANTYSLTGLTLLPLASMDVQHGTPWTPTGTGNYDLKVWIQNTNNTGDQNNLNDTISKTLQVAGSSAQRKVLLESFTSSTCAPCVAGNQAISALTAANNEKYTLVKYQMSWPAPGDPYNNADGNTRRTFYGVNSVPHFFADGGFNDNPVSFNQALFNEAYAKPSFLSINAWFKQVSGTVTVDVEVNPLANFPTAHRLHVAVIENFTTGNVGTNGETIFYNVEQKMLPNGNGTAIASFTAGTPYTKTLSASMQTTKVEDLNNLSVVVWVQNHSTKEVLQSVMAYNTSGIGEEEGNTLTSLYPNPAAGQAFLDYHLDTESDVSISICDLSGKEVLSLKPGRKPAGAHQQELDITGLQSGMYLVTVNLGRSVITRRLTVQ